MLRFIDKKLLTVFPMKEAAPSGVSLVFGGINASKRLLPAMSVMEIAFEKAYRQPATTQS